MSNSKLPFLRKDTVDGKKRLWRVVPTVATIAAAAVGAAFIGGVAGPANAAAPTRPAFSIASGSNANTAVARYVTVSGGRFTLDTAAAEKAGVSSQALSAEGTIVASLNTDLARNNATAYGSQIGTFKAPLANTREQAAATADGKSTTITLVPGITLTISNTGLVVSITKADVTEITNVAGFAKDLTSIVTTAVVDNPAVVLAISAAMVAITGNPAAAVTGPVIAAAGAFVSAAIGIATDVLKICTAADGSATFTIPWFGIPSCSAQ